MNIILGSMARFAKSLMGEFFRYCIVGGISFIVDFGVLSVSMELYLEKLSYGLYLATCFGFVAGLIANYLLSLKFVFTQPKDRQCGRSVCAFLIFGIIGVLGLGWTELGMWLGVSVLGVHYMLVKIVVTGLVLVWNYLGRKLLIFNKQEKW